MMDFCGKPLFMWSVMQAENSKLVDKVVVSTDDDEIMIYAENIGADVVRRDYVSDSQTLEEVIEHLGLNYNLRKKDTLICLQPTSPLRLSRDIDKAIKQLKGTGINSIFSCNIEDDLFLFDQSLVPLTFRLSDRQKDKFHIRENGSFYIIEMKSYFGSRYAGLRGFYPMQKWQSFEIDELQDIEICKFFMRKYIL